jgi:hypothetical protein
VDFAAFVALTTGFGFGFAGAAPFFLPGGAMNPETGMGDNRSEYVDLVLGGMRHSMYFFIPDRTQRCTKARVWQ